MPQRKYFRIVSTAIGNAATQPSVDLDKAPNNCEWHYQRISMLNDTTANADLKIQVIEPARTVDIAIILNTVANEIKVYDNQEIVVKGEDFLRLLWVGSANGDALIMVAEGYLWVKD